MSPTVEERDRTIKEIVCSALEAGADDIDETTLFTDRGAGSMVAIEILARLEEEFGMIISQAQLARMVNLESVRAVAAEAGGWTA
jgi:acyl carrier protein